MYANVIETQIAEMKVLSYKMSTDTYRQIMQWKLKIISEKTVSDKRISWKSIKKDKYYFNCSCMFWLESCRLHVDRQTFLFVNQMKNEKLKSVSTVVWERISYKRQQGKKPLKSYVFCLFPETSKRNNTFFHFFVNRITLRVSSY